jgi:2-methylfumaryl-CoA isomerase
MGQLAEVLTTGANRPRLGNSLFGAFGRDFATADGRRIMVVAITPKQWRGLVSALGLNDAVATVEGELGVSFVSNEGARFDHRDRLFPLFEAAFAVRTTADLGPAFDADGVTWGPYQSLHEAATTDKRLFTENPVFQTIANPSGLTYPASGPAGTLAGEPRGAITPAPKLGQHTDQVLAEVLGLPDHEIGRLHDAGLVAGPEA